MSFTCVPIYSPCLEYKRVFIRFTLARLISIVILLFDVAFTYLLEKWRIWRYSYLLETLISSEYGLTISGHVTVLR